VGTVGFDHCILLFYSLYQAGTRRPLAFSPSTDMGLTDIEMAHNLDYDDPFFDDRVGYEMEYEVGNFYFLFCCLYRIILRSLCFQFSYIYVFVLS
jgi:hypothetical protein